MNHSVPTHHEIQYSIKWLLEKYLIIKENSSYKPTDEGKN